jgi:ATP-citrate lyase beta-subunit
MARNKLSEYRSKIIVNSIVDTMYVGWSVNKGLEGIDAIMGFNSYVVKVDQAVKKRFKNGLVSLDVAQGDIVKKIRTFSKQGYEHFIVEPFVKHQQWDERYISFRRDRSGIIVSFSASGGVDIEDDASSIESLLLSVKTLEKIAAQTELSVENLLSFQNKFNELHLSLLEINPYIIKDGSTIVLDAAIEVDSAAAHLVKGWGESDLRYSVANHTKEELSIRALNDESSASFNLSVLNKEGSIFLLLSGGGASVVIADEIYSLGLGKEIANYGEYSGNPTRHETYLYTREVLSLVIHSNAKTKVLFIGGAVANFTDIATTFNGVIDALEELSEKLKKSNLKVYVRRGGPREKEGLRRMEEALDEMNILGGVYDPSISISTAVKRLAKALKA